MKKITTLFVIVTAACTALCLVLICCGEPSAASNEEAFLQKTQATLEDSIDLSSHPVDPDTARLYIDTGTKVLSVLGMTLPANAEELDKMALYALRDSARNIHQNDTGTCANYITALRIIYGLDTLQRQMFLLYQPISLCRKANTANYYTVHEGSGTCYTYYSGAFSPASTSDLAKVLLYKNYIRIKRHDPALDRKFYVSTDSTGDVASIIYSFQEMDSVMIANNSQSVKLWNYAFRTKVSGVTHTKHNLFLSPDSFSLLKVVKNGKKEKELKLFTPFPGKFANHSHFCPPTCAELSYKLVQH